MRALPRVALLPVLLISLTGADGGAPPDLTTTAERTSFARTGRYDEVQRLCADFPAAYPGRVRCFTFGRTPEGRSLWALAASDDGTLEPEAVREHRRPVVFFEGGIHAGEIDGKDAGFAALRELLDGRPAGALKKVTALFVPVFNADGHERFGPHHRPNQRGPEETGTRTTAQNLNLNRDWVKAETPEMAAMLGLVEAWDPTVFADLHDTDGARFQHDVSLVVTPEAPSSSRLAAAARGLRDELITGLGRRGHLPIPFYPALRTDDDPSSGFTATPLPPRYSTTYLATRNRLAILVEVHSWKTYAERVRATGDLLAVLFEVAASKAAGWRKLEQAIDQETTHLGGTDVALAYDAVDPPRTIDFLGYAYARAPSEISGVTWIHYDEQRPQVWQVPLYDRLLPSVVVRAPRAGYLVPAAHAAWLAAKLDLHGVRYQKLEGPPRPLPVQAFRATQVTFAPAPFEGRFTATVRGAWRPERQTATAGALFVPIDQPRARLILALLEPTAPDSLLSWGFFHAAFEEKEAMEGYVTEEQARLMLERDPELRAAFNARLASDPAFAGSPRQRLRFFQQRHPSWDDHLDLYPVLRLDAKP